MHNWLSAVDIWPPRFVLILFAALAGFLMAGCVRHERRPIVIVPATQPAVIELHPRPIVIVDPRGHRILVEPTPRGRW